ncbi:PDZ domain [Plasmopara halstedii]|uniref:PDZ domain n=1 Tax=Plasmopara halstedii TaxID=4781 RepID=A0A0P1AUS0_PLAHL|nr:PDZ domain [Plasmopara halstedii]CEG44735.1 PDZ domain [Plasmopara halstedii]|eukprot:XP_024581104.1 PDZ domain [Plasmopara halstedii]
MVDTQTPTKPAQQANVVNLEKDVLIGVRLRVSFGSRAFWGTVVDCYWVSGGLFYKVSFDDGDVDILPADEVMRDAEAAKTHAKENPQHKNKQSNSDTEEKDYFPTMRLHKLKRKRDDGVYNSASNVRQVNLWGQRLYASIYTNKKNETFVKEFLKTEDGQIGEMEATGQVKIGDMILAVNEIRVLGMPSRELAELIRKPKRPIKLILYRPQLSNQLPQEDQEEHLFAASSDVSTTTSLQTQHHAPLLPNVSQAPALSFVTPEQALANQVPVSRMDAQQWTQSSQQLLTKEYIWERVRQNILARQAADSARVPVPISVHLTHPHHFVPTFTNTAASGLPVSGIQPAKPMFQPFGAAAQAMGGNQRQGITSINNETLQQSLTHRNSVATTGNTYDLTQSPQTTTTDTTMNVVQQSVSQDGQHHNLASSRHPKQAATSVQNTTNSVISEDTSRPVASSPTSGSRARTTDNIASTAELTTRHSLSSKGLLKELVPNSSLLSSCGTPETTEIENASGTTSFLSSSTLVDKRTEFESIDKSQPMSFLSPNDFNVDFEATTRSVEQIETAAKEPDEVKSNVGLVFVKVSRSRLCLTLGIQGTLIAVTSFVLDEFGKPGEVELSGKVFIGDVLVRINETNIVSGMTPNTVAEIVNSVPRPLTLWFERASWEILDGKA